MGKYSFEFKKKVVQAYLAGEGGYRFLAKQYDIASKTDIENWVATYETFGTDGLLRSRKRKTYSFEFKLGVVESY